MGDQVAPAAQRRLAQPGRSPPAAAADRDTAAAACRRDPAARRNVSVRNRYSAPGAAAGAAGEQLADPRQIDAHREVGHRIRRALGAQQPRVDDPCGSSSTDLPAMSAPDALDARVDREHVGDAGIASWSNTQLPSPSGALPLTRSTCSRAASRSTGASSLSLDSAASCVAAASVAAATSGPVASTRAIDAPCDHTVTASGPSSGRFTAGFAAGRPSSAARKLAITWRARRRQCAGGRCETLRTRSPSRRDTARGSVHTAISATSRRRRAPRRITRRPGTYAEHARPARDIRY
jgi:hypothetical protein